MWLIINKRPWLNPGLIVNTGIQGGRGFAEAGAVVEFVVAGRTADWLQDMRRFYGLEPHPNLTVKVIPRFRLGRLSGSFPLFLYPFIRCNPWRSEVRPLYIFSRDSGMLPYMVLLKRFYGARIFLEVHHAYADVRRLVEEGFDLSPEEKKNCLLERLFGRKVDLLICITAPQAELYREVFPQVRLVVLPLGARLKPSLSAPEKFNKRQLVYAGAFHKAKGLETLLHAMAGTDPKTSLLLVGGTRGGREWVSKQVERLGLASRVRLLGALAPAEVARICAEEASAGVLPPEDNFYNRNLSSPAKLSDYRSFSLPVIASRLPTTESLLAEDRDAIFFEPGNVQSLSRAIDELFSDKKRFCQLVRGSEQQARQWSWRQRALLLIKSGQAMWG